MFDKRIVVALLLFVVAFVAVTLVLSFAASSRAKTQEDAYFTKGKVKVIKLLYISLFYRFVFILFWLGHDPLRHPV